MKIAQKDPKTTATIFSSEKVIRDHPTKALTPVELENYVSQAVWKFFNHSRSVAASRLEVGEMDLITTDVRVIGIKIDGHQVINPIGFTGRELEITLSVSMSKDVPSNGETHIEGGAVRAYMIAMLQGLEKAYYIESQEGLTTVFVVDRGSVKHISSFDWGRKDVLFHMQDHFDLDEEHIWPVYRKYSTGEMSGSLSKRFDKAFFESFNGLVNAVAMIIRNDGALKKDPVPPVYINAHFDLPDKVFKKRFNFDTKKPLRLQKIEENLDVEGFLGDSSDSIYEDLNEIARRRIKWATPKK